MNDSLTHGELNDFSFEDLHSRTNIIVNPMTDA